MNQVSSADILTGILLVCLKKTNSRECGAQHLHLMYCRLQGHLLIVLSQHFGDRHTCTHMQCVFTTTLLCFIC